MKRFAPRFAKLVIVGLLLAPTTVGAQSGLLGSLLGNLPIVGPLVNKLVLPLVGNLLSTDLLELVVNGDDRPVRAIVRGDVAAIQTAAARDGIPVLRVLDGIRRGRGQRRACSTRCRMSPASHPSRSTTSSVRP